MCPDEPQRGNRDVGSNATSSVVNGKKGWKGKSCPAYLDRHMLSGVPTRPPEYSTCTRYWNLRLTQFWPTYLKGNLIQDKPGLLENQQFILGENKR